jgi:fatty aldehyde decarbonylase
MEKEDLMADFMASYQEVLSEIGFSSREIARLATAALLG